MNAQQLLGEVIRNVGAMMSAGIDPAEIEVSGFLLGPGERMEPVYIYWDAATLHLDFEKALP